jgi:hypothetical protein
MTGIEYINQQINETRRKMDSWKLGTQTLSKKDMDILEKSLIMLDNDEEKVKALMLEKVNDSKTYSPEDEFNKILSRVAESLKDDLYVYTNKKYDDILYKIGFGILECGTIHAGCVRVNDYGKTLDGHGIFINIGTYYALQLIAKSIIIENFENDFESYRRDASEFIDLASNIYFTQTSNPTREIFFYDYPDDVQVEASAAQSSVVIKVMQFISLHELGHIVNGDFEIMGFHARFMNSKPDVSINLPKDVDVEQSHEEEYAADLFALNALFDNDSSHISKWSSFYTIYYFLIWLDSIEKKLGQKLSNLHPNSIVRAKRLQRKLLELTDGKDYGYIKHLDNIIIKLDKWSRK